MCSLPEREPPAPGSCGVVPDGSLLPSSAARGLGVSAAWRMLWSLHPPPCSSRSPPLLHCYGNPLAQASPPRCPAANLLQTSGGWGGQPSPPHPHFFSVLRRQANTAVPARSMHTGHCPLTSCSTSVFLQPAVSGSGSCLLTRTCRGQ